jgi:Skp family chaperone for outer membrane proteins
MRETYPMTAALTLAFAFALVAAPAVAAAQGAATAAAPAAGTTLTPIPPPPITAAAGPAAPPVGPLVTGVCLLSQEGLITRSKPGQAATMRLKEMQQKAQSEFAAEQAHLQARVKALEARRASLPPMQFDAQGQALTQREQALQAEAGERSRALEAAKAKAIDDVLTLAKPLVTKAYAAHGCGLLFAREAVLLGNFGNDLTPEVVAALDAPAAPATPSGPTAAK